jgi:hypothetical protein
MTKHKLTLESALKPVAQFNRKTSLYTWKAFNTEKIWPNSRVSPFVPGEVECYDGTDLRIHCTCGAIFRVSVVEARFIKCPGCERLFRIYHMLESVTP